MRSALAVATLALGIGAATAIFSFVNPLLLNPFTYPHADQLVLVSEHNAQGRPSLDISYPAYRDWSTQTRVLPQLGAFDVGFFFLTGVEEAEQVAGALVTTNLFHALGVAPALGRDFRDGEEGVVILTDACWRRRFGADPNILGRTIALDWARTPEVERYTVIGVMPEKFWMYYSGFEVFVPLGKNAIRDDRRFRTLVAIGRRAGSIDQVRSALAAIPDEKDWTPQVISWEHAATEPLRSELLVLAAGAALLLLIASANVAGLLLVRAQARRREIAIRAALGANPWRLAAMLTGESLKLGIAAAGLGILLAWWGVRLILALRPTDLYIMQLSPGLDRIAIDPAALIFAVGAALIACLLAGIFPALKARRVDVTAALKDSAAPESQRARKLLVTAEVAISVTLLAGAGLLIKTLAQLHRVDLGFRPDHMLAMRLPMPQAQARDLQRRAIYFRDVLARVSALPEVRSAALSEHLPDVGVGDTLPSAGRGPGDFEIPGRSERMNAVLNGVSSAYFSTLGIPILRGRAFTESDTHRVVISAAAARRWWPEENPVGRTIYRAGESYEIIGVAGDTSGMIRDPRGVHFGANLRPVVYLPMRDAMLAGYFLALRTASDPLALSHSVRAAVGELGGVVAEMDTMERSIENATWQNQQAAGLLGAFAALALLLSGVGLYGVLSFAIARRTREIGIRVAVGARRWDVIALVAAESARPVIAGMAVGLAAALAMGRLLASLLYRTAPSDPWVLAGVAIATAITGLIACLLPLRRALSIDPAAALRME